MSARLRIEGCPLCGAQERQRWLTALGFELVRCSSCQHRYSTETLTLGQLGHDYYNESEDNLDARTSSAKRSRFDEYMALFPSVANETGRVLDVGCNAGELLSLFQDRGWDVEGIELSPGPAAYARKILGAPIHTAPVEQFDAERGPYDLITLIHVLEHLHDPVAVLSKLGELVSDGGALLVEVPNADDPLLTAFGGFYRPLCPGDHLSFFDGARLHDVLAASGWTCPRLFSPIHPRDVVYGALMSTADIVRTRGGRRLAGDGGVTSQVRYRGRWRHTVKSALDTILESVDPLLTSVSDTRGAVLIALAERA